MIEPKEKNTFKSMEKVKTCLQKAFCAGQNNVGIKKIVKRKEDIVMEAVANEALEKLKNSTEMKSSP